MNSLEVFHSGALVAVMLHQFGETDDHFLCYSSCYTATTFVRFGPNDVFVPLINSLLGSIDASNQSVGLKILQSKQLPHTLNNALLITSVPLLNFTELSLKLPARPSVCRILVRN